MAIPGYQSLMLPVLKAASKKEVHIGAVIDALANELALSPEQRSELLLSGKQTIFSNRVHWAKSYLSKAGLVELTRRGHFKITPRGQEVLQSNPAAIDVRLLNQFEEFRQFRERSNDTENDSGNQESTTLVEQKQTPDEIMQLAHQQIESVLAQELLDRVRNAPPEFFEQLIINLLRSMGYGVGNKEGHLLGKPGDNGVDGVIYQDVLGLDRVYIQAKRYGANNSIGSSDIRDFFGSLDRHKASKGLFVTTSSFSHSAVETAGLLSKRIVLVNGKKLAELMVQHNFGCRNEKTLEIKKIDEEFFEV